MERVLYYTLMALFTVSLVVSIALGLRFVKGAGVEETSDPGQASTGTSRQGAAKGSTLPVSGQPVQFGTPGLP